MIVKESYSGWMGAPNSCFKGGEQMSVHGPFKCQHQSLGSEHGINSIHAYISLYGRECLDNVAVGDFFSNL